MKHYHIVNNNSKTNINKIIYTQLIMKLYTVGCISSLNTEDKIQ